MTLRESLARWLAPEAFRKTRARKAALDRLALPPLDAAPKRDDGPPVVHDAPQHGRHTAPPDVAPEYEAMIALNWGQMPVAATLTRSRVRLLQTAHAPPHEIRLAIAGTEIVIE